MLSILVAFGLDAWWDYAKQRNAETDHLRALLIDFEQTRAGMEATIAHGERIVEHAKALSAAIDADAAPTDARMDAMLFELMSLPTFEPVVGA
ncbi:MAG: hypothetical protein VYD05_09925 [Planctomycetota bacterium]|nr:hypothetical protein [Planctomycetota bacterium]